MGNKGGQTNGEGAQAPSPEEDRQMAALRHAIIALVLVCIPAAPQAGVKRHEIPLEGSPSMGPEDAAVTIVEFLDYQ